MPKGDEQRKAILAGLADMYKPGDIIHATPARGFTHIGEIFYRVVKYVRGEGYLVQPLQAVEVPGQYEGKHSIEPGDPIGKTTTAEVFTTGSYKGGLHMAFGMSGFRWNPSHGAVFPGD